MSEACVIKHLLDKSFWPLKYENKLLIITNGRPTPGSSRVTVQAGEKQEYFQKVVNELDKLIDYRKVAAKRQL